MTGGHAYVGTVGAIRRVNLATQETTILAGSASSGSCINATDAAAVRFGRIIDVTTDGTYIYSVGECPAPYYRQVRRTSIATGATSTVVNFQVGLAEKITFGPDRKLYLGTGSSYVYRIDPITGAVSTLATVSGNVYAVAADANYVWAAVAAVAGNRIDRISVADGTVTSFVTTDAVGVHALASAGDYLYAARHENLGYGFIRRYRKSDGSRVDPAGTSFASYADGTGTDAWFADIRGIATDGTTLWIADSANHRLRRAVQGKLPDAQGGPTRPYETLGAGNPAEKKTDCDRADPVKCATGNFWEESTDLVIPGRGVPLRFGRTYNSLAAARDGPLGYGWTHTYAMSVSDDPYTPGTKNVTQENGSQVSFTSTQNGWPK